MKECKVSYEDLAHWVKFAAHAHKFMVVKKQCEKLMGSASSNPSADLIAAFSKRYNIIWNYDDSFDLIPK